MYVSKIDILLNLLSGSAANFRGFRIFLGDKQEVLEFFLGINRFILKKEKVPKIFVSMQNSSICGLLPRHE